MRKNDKMEIGRKILHNAVAMNMNKKIVLRISQKIDQYVVEHYRCKGGGQDDREQREDVPVCAPSIAGDSLVSFFAYSLD